MEVLALTNTTMGVYESSMEKLNHCRDGSLEMAKKILHAVTDAAGMDVQRTYDYLFASLATLTVTDTKETEEMQQLEQYIAEQLTGEISRLLYDATATTGEDDLDAAITELRKNSPYGDDLTFTKELAYRRTIAPETLAQDEAMQRFATTHLAKLIEEKRELLKC